MKLYEYDRGVYGISIAIANSKNDALNLFKANGVRDCTEITVNDIEEHEIYVGLVIDNIGDA